MYTTMLCWEQAGVQIRTHYPGPKRPTGRPPEGPDSDPIRIRAARELIKKIQIVTLNDDLGFYRPANWVNPTEKPTPP